MDIEGIIRKDVPATKRIERAVNILIVFFVRFFVNLPRIHAKKYIKALVAAPARIPPTQI